MDAKFLLLLISWVSVLAGVVLIVLHFTLHLSVVWGSAFLAVGTVASLIAVSLLRRDIRRAKEEAAREARHQKKKK